MKDLFSIETVIYLLAIFPIVDETLEIMLGVDSKEWIIARRDALIHKTLKSKVDIASNANTIKD